MTKRYRLVHPAIDRWAVIDCQVPRYAGFSNRGSASSALRQMNADPTYADMFVWTEVDTRYTSPADAFKAATS